MNQFDFVNADELDDIQTEIDQQNDTLDRIREDLDKSKAQVEQLASTKGNLYWQLSNIQEELTVIQSQISTNQSDIEELNASTERVNGLIASRLEQKNERLKNIYIDIKIPAIESFLTLSSLDDASRLIAYKEAGIRADREEILTLNSQLANLQSNLAESQKLHEELSAVNAELETQLTDVNSQIAGINSQIVAEEQKQADINGQISEIENLLGELTAKQEALIKARIEAANKQLKLSDGDPLTASIPNAPFTGGFTVASYGAPHRVGMNQYGALGRANDGQSAAQILNAYFANIKIDKKYGSDFTITVSGTNEYGQTFNNQEYNIEEYLKHLYEMPSTWPAEALKAQAIAARTYALKYTKDGANPICPNQNCQVVKLEKNSAAWQTAVDATKGWVIKNNGTLITPWYSSTAGGYTKLPTEVGWYSNPAWVKSIKDFGSNGAYDGPSYGDSPWYHRAWGEVGGVWGGSCSQNCHPWLTNEQMQDLFNVMLLREVVSDEYNSHFSPVNWGDEDTWNEQQVIEKLNEHDIIPMGKISVIAAYENQNNGDTTKVVVTSENYVAKEFNATDFKSVFYMRSPGTLIIRSSRFDFVSS